MFLRFLDKIERRERIGNAITLRKEKDTWLWIYGLKATGSLSKAVLKNDPLWWNGISRVSRCYLSLPTQYQFVIPQTGGDIKAELRPSFGRDFHINIKKNINSNMIWLTWKIGKMIRDRKWKLAAPPRPPMLFCTPFQLLVLTRLLRCLSHSLKWSQCLD